MASKLVWVGVSGLVICAICLSGAAAIGGKALRDTGFDFDFGGKPRCKFDLAGKSGSRAIAWDGGNKVGIDLPASVHYRPGSGADMVVTGDTALLPHIGVSDGDIELDCRRPPGQRLEITLPGRAFRKFSLAGTGSLTLADLDQPELKIEVAGHGDVTASGKTDKLTLSMAGANDAQLGDLAAGDATVELAGSNDVEISARGDLRVDLAGRGTVKLRIEPAHIKTSIAGHGDIIHPR